MPWGGAGGPRVLKVGLGKGAYFLDYTQKRLGHFWLCVWESPRSTMVPEVELGFLHTHFEAPIVHRNYSWRAGETIYDVELGPRWAMCKAKTLICCNLLWPQTPVFQ